MNCKLLSILLTLTAGVVPLDAQKPVQGPKKPAVGINPQPAPRQEQGNAWFPEVRKNLGTFFENETARGEFSFRNPKDEPVVWKHLQGSCQCSKAVIRIGDRTYELTKKSGTSPLQRVEGNNRTPVTQIEIGAGEEGTVEVFMEISGAGGTRQASVDIHTEDPDTPMIKLNYSAAGAQLFLLSPKEINFNEMTWNESREFTVTVTSPIAKDFNILAMDDAGEDFEVSYSKEMVGEVANWTIRGKYQPKSGDTMGGGVLKFRTDARDDANFLVRISAMIKGPLDVKPGTFLTLGMVRQGKSKVASVTLVPNDGSDLAATAIKFERLSVDPKYLTTRQKKDGKNLVIELEISDETPRGLLRGDMVIDLNHAAIKRKKILFNGYVR
jgi:hypothetical protein